MSAQRRVRGRDMTLREEEAEKVQNCVYVVRGGNNISYCAENHKFGDFRRQAGMMRGEGGERATSMGGERGPKPNL